MNIESMSDEDQGIRNYKNDKEFLLNVTNDGKSENTTNNSPQCSSSSPLPFLTVLTQTPQVEAVNKLQVTETQLAEAPDISASSSTISSAFINISPCFKSPKFRHRLQFLLLGQVMSLCLCGTGVASQLLADKKFNAPAAQTLLTYFFLAFIYGVVIFFRSSANRSFATILQKSWWKYFLLAFIDFEANYLVVYAYQFTNLTSIQLLNCFTIPVIMLLSWLILSVRYEIRHITGVAICLMGVAIIIGADAVTGLGLKGGNNKLLGDVLCISATILYGIANVSEEFLVKQYDRFEYLGMIGLFGFIISAIQLVALESNVLSSIEWDINIIFYYLIFTACMVLFYSLVSIVVQNTSALMFNLCVLTASFYSLLVNTFFFNQVFRLPYFFSFLVILIGSTIYTSRKTKEATARDRESFCRFINCCCPWISLCCGDCTPPKSSYTVEQVQGERSISSVSMDIRSEIHSSVSST